MFKLKKVALFLALFCIITSPIHANLASPHVSLPSPYLGLVNEATYIKPLAANTIMHVYVSLKFRHKEQLDQLVAEIYDPQSPKFHHYISHDEFEQQFAPTKEAEKAVQRYFEALGLEAKIVHHAIQVRATTYQIEQALKIKINQYRYQNRTVFANATAPTLPADIASSVLEIRGLSNIVHYGPPIHKKNDVAKEKLKKSHDLNFVWDTFLPKAQPSTNSLNGITGAQLQGIYYSNNIYIGPTLINGAGQTIVIVDYCENNNAATIMADANVYNSNNGIAPFTTSTFKVLTSNAETPYTRCQLSHSGWDSEIALDVQSSHTMAPGSNTVLVLDGQNVGLDQTLINVISVIASSSTYSIGGLPNAYVVSNSWFSIGNETNTDVPSLDQALERAAATGISVNFISGDCGDNSYASTWPCTVDPNAPSVEYPSTSPYVTTVGGTSLFVSSDWQYAFEIGWGTYNNGGISGAGIGYWSGSTGGLSKIFNTQNSPSLSSWQGNTNHFSSFTASGYNVTVGNARAVPDIAMLADPQTGLWIYYTGSSSNPVIYGGTSLACPLFSGVLTLVNQARQISSHGVIGQIAPILYTNNNALYANETLNPIIAPHAIISGATLPNIAGVPYSAFMINNIVFGWDASLTNTPTPTQFWNDVVGVGSPNIPNFVTYLSTMS